LICQVIHAGQGLDDVCLQNLTDIAGRIHVARFDDIDRRRQYDIDVARFALRKRWACNSAERRQAQ
jgi:hypothetical protein